MNECDDAMYGEWLTIARRVVNRICFTLLDEDKKDIEHNAIHDLLLMKEKGNAVACDSLLLACIVERRTVDFLRREHAQIRDARRTLSLDAMLEERGERVEDNLPIDAQIAAATERFEILMDALNALGEPAKTIIIAYYFDELDAAQTAAIVGGSEASVSKNRQRALQSLRASVLRQMAREKVSV
jgi:RNA polymerase sigma factor (sigma-70 family)